MTNLNNQKVNAEKTGGTTLVGREELLVRILEKIDFVEVPYSDEESAGAEQAGQ